MKIKQSQIVSFTNELEESINKLKETYKSIYMTFALRPNSGKLVDKHLEKRINEILNKNV